MPPKALFIISKARSGSNQLLNYINQVPGCRCYGEIFRRGFPGKRKGWQSLASHFPDKEAARALHGSDISAFWDQLVAAHEGAARVVGATIFYLQRAKDPLWEKVYDPNSMVIHLWRDRVFDAYVAQLRARHNSARPQEGDAAPDEKEGARRGAKAALHFDRDDYLKYRRKARRNYASALERLQDHPNMLSVEYSEIGDPAALSGKLGTFFGETVSLSEVAKKQPRRAPTAFLANPEEAEAFVRDRLVQRKGRKAAAG